MQILLLILIVVVIGTSLVLGIYFWMKPAFEKNTSVWFIAIFGDVLIYVAGWLIMGGYNIFREQKAVASGIRGDFPKGKYLAAAVGIIIPLDYKLKSPLTQLDCVYYTYSMGHEELDSEKKRVDVVDFSGEAMVPCAVKTSYSIVRLLSKPALLKGFKSAFPDDYNRADLYIESTKFDEFNLNNPLDALAYANEIVRLLELKTGEMRSDVKLSYAENSQGLNLKEEIVPPGAEVCVIGKFDSKEKAFYTPKFQFGATSGIQIIKGKGKSVLTKLRWKSASLLIIGAILLIATIVGLFIMRAKAPTLNIKVSENAKKIIVCH